MGIYKPGRPHKYYPGTQTGSKPPASPGEYRIRNKEGQITYVGETNSLARRLGEHQRAGKLSGGQNAGGSFEWSLADGRSSSKTRREHERLKIAQHSPEGTLTNASRGGEGRIAGRNRKTP